MPYSDSFQSRPSITSWSNDIGPSDGGDPTSTSNDCLKALSDIHPNYASRVQSRRFPDDVSPQPDNFDKLLLQDLRNHIVQVNSFISFRLFPDNAFGFPLFSTFILQFSGTFLSSDMGINLTNFTDETKTAVFLNRMVSTIWNSLRENNQSLL